MQHIIFLKTNKKLRCQCLAKSVLCYSITIPFYLSARCKIDSVMNNVRAGTVVCHTLHPYAVFLCAEYEGGLLKRSAYSLAM